MEYMNQRQTCLKTCNHCCYGKTSLSKHKVKNNRPNIVDDVFLASTNNRTKFQQLNRKLDLSGPQDEKHYIY